MYMFTSLCEWVSFIVVAATCTCSYSTVCKTLYNKSMGCVLQCVSTLVVVIKLVGCAIEGHSNAQSVIMDVIEVVQCTCMSLFDGCSVSHNMLYCNCTLLDIDNIHNITCCIAALSSCTSTVVNA